MIGSVNNNPLLVITSFKMRSAVAREVKFGKAVAYMISAEQRAIETVASMTILRTFLFFISRFRGKKTASLRS